MTFVEGFLTPCPTANKDAYLKHAREAGEYFRSMGMTRFVECWGDDVPDGKINDLKQAVQLKSDEALLFSWFEYPDRATRDAASQKMSEDSATMTMEMPFDGKRMIWGGFEAIVDEGPGGEFGYVDGVVLPVPAKNRETYRAYAQSMDQLFLEHGATRVVEAWGEDVKDGKVTDYNRAARVEGDEKVVYSWIEWPSKEVRDAAWAKLMQDERMTKAGPSPFDAKRMMFGGFAPILKIEY